VVADLALRWGRPQPLLNRSCSIELCGSSAEAANSAARKFGGKVTFDSLPEFVQNLLLNVKYGGVRLPFGLFFLASRFL
jgi:hypothetical protein